MPTIVGPLLNPDKVSLAKGDRDCFLTLLDLQPMGLPLRLAHCSCPDCEVGEVVDVMNTSDGRTWAVATTDLPRERCAGYVFSLGGNVIDAQPADLVTPRLTVLREVSLVEASGSYTAPVRWQPLTLCSWNRGGYVQGTTAHERQVLDHAASRLTFQQRAGVIEVVTLPSTAPPPVVPPRAPHTRTVTALDPFNPPTATTHRNAAGDVIHTRYFGSAPLRFRQ